jgi:hypothetical protein
VGAKKIVVSIPGKADARLFQPPQNALDVVLLQPNHR